MTILESAKAGIITPEMEICAQDEQVSPEFIRAGIADGSIVVLKSSRENIHPVAVGKGMTTKVSASVGMYEPQDTPEGELAKIDAALRAGTDTIMDLSVRGDIRGLREQVLSQSKIPVGTLPIYQTLWDTEQKYGTNFDMTAEDMLATIEEQAEEGVSFLAMHPATTLDVIRTSKEEGRLDPLVSWGGSHLIGWMLLHYQENPLYTHFDRIIEICHKNDVVLSFADGMRPGCIDDSLDSAQVMELVIIGTLVRRAREKGVQVMVKGPGHVPLDEIETTVKLMKKLCHNVPYFVFGCLPTDRAAGADHVTSAIGGAVASYYGADFLCYVTPAEHIGMPDNSDVYEGVMASRIAAHAGDVAKGHPGALAWDRKMSEARRSMNWKRQFDLSIDPERAERMWRERSTSFTSECTMCGKYCAVKIVERYLRPETSDQSKTVVTEEASA
ncbi:MAG: phosphomethylpyrimidine synthase ThiC [Eubacteriaceae bacterium]